VEALYTMEDAMAALRLLKPLPYQKRSTLCAGVEVCFVDAGHLLGSASIEIWLSENGVSKKLVCSGDIGNQNQPIIRDPQYLTRGQRDCACVCRGAHAGAAVFSALDS
ncbi:MAG: hypothetical protein RR825_07275, partial [Ruthenibacterium sp.]